MSAPAEPTAAGLHVRAGNAMGRTRAGLLDGALTVIERDGLHRVTMSAVANRSGVAKATLYNHFRTKDDVLGALVVREVELVADDTDEALAQARAAGADDVGTSAAGLARAAGAVTEHVAGRRVASQDPAALGALLVEDDGPGWSLARARLGALLGLPPAHALVRLAAGWLVGQLFDPQEPETQSATATMLARAAAQARREPVPGAVPEPAADPVDAAAAEPEPAPGPG